MKIFGFDKFGKVIRDGSIVKFLENGKNKIGHVWQCQDDYSESYGDWIVSFNHCYSETSNKIDYKNFKNVRVIGFGYDDEYLLEDYYE